MVYLFTNHQNLVQAATKGYLSPFCNWRRFTPDFESIGQKSLNEVLVFGTQPLPFPYTHESDKFLHAVAVGVDEEVLTKLGYTKSGDHYIGVNPILFSSISEIIFETTAGPTLLKNRYENYFVLLGRVKFPPQPSLFNKSECDLTINLDERLTTPVQERRYDRAFGALGHILAELIETQVMDYPLTVFLLGSHLSSRSLPLDAQSLIEFARNLLPSWNVNASNIHLLYLLLGYLWEGSDWKTAAIRKTYGVCGERVFIFLGCLDKVLDETEKTIKTMDRKQLFELIQNCYFTAGKPDPFIKNVIDKILMVYDYDYTTEDLISDIQSDSDQVLKDFLLGLEFFSRDPIDPKNISQLKASIEYNQEQSVYAVALFLWGRTHGAFSMEPFKKLNMLSMFGESNFNRLCAPGYPFAELKENPTIQPDKSKHPAHEYLGTPFWREVGPTEDRGEYLIRTERILSSGGFNMEYTTEDHFDDVQNFMVQVEEGSITLAVADIAYLLNTWVHVSGQLSLGAARYDIQYSSLENLTLNLEGKPIRGNSATIPIMIEFESTKAINELVKSELRTIVRSASMKQAIRERFLLANDTRTVPMEEKEIEVPGSEAKKPVTPSPAEKVEQEPTEKDKNEDIKAYMKRHGIPLPTKKTKLELLKAIKNHPDIPELSF